MDTTTPAVESQPQEVRIGTSAYRVHSDGKVVRFRRGIGATWMDSELVGAVRRVAELEKENAELREALEPFAMSVLTPPLVGVLGKASASPVQASDLRAAAEVWRRMQEGATSER